MVHDTGRPPKLRIAVFSALGLWALYDGIMTFHDWRELSFLWRCLGFIGSLFLSSLWIGALYLAWDWMARKWFEAHQAKPQ